MLADVAPRQTVAFDNFCTQISTAFMLPADVSILADILNLFKVVYIYALIRIVLIEQDDNPVVNLLIKC